MTNSFEKSYPYITSFIKEHGWIELGQDEFSPSLVRAIDPGGLIWEGQTHYSSLDAALQALEDALRAWIKESFSSDYPDD